jgi:hypothetical protein
VVCVAVGPVGPQEGVSDGAFVVGLAMWRFERAGRMGRGGGRRSRLVGFARKGRHDYVWGYKSVERILRDTGGWA